MAEWNIDSTDREGFGARSMEVANRLLKNLMFHRERYLKAWVAETGIMPSEAILCQRYRMDGVIETWVKRRSAEEGSRG